MTLIHGHTGLGQPAKTYINSMWILGVILMTYSERWLIGTDGEREREKVKGIYDVSMS